MSDIERLITVFMAFFAIMNPIANTAVFASLTAENTEAEKRRIAAKAILITFIVILLFSILGKSIFHIFGIGLPALRITGGILVFLVGYHMLHGSGSQLHKINPENEIQDIAVSPLAVPLLAGPGTIATAMNYSASGEWLGISITLLSFLALCLITFICFIFSSEIVTRIGENGLSIVTRLMGLILAVIGMQMLVAGANSAFPNL